LGFFGLFFFGLGLFLAWAFSGLGFFWLGLFLAWAFSGLKISLNKLG
jgi:hypothetical protein